MGNPILDTSWKPLLIYSLSLNSHHLSILLFSYEWAIPYLMNNPDPTKKRCLLKLEAPECKAAPWSRHNHLGNGADDAEPLRYEWTLPHFPSMTQDGEKKPFVLRIRLVKLLFCFV